MTEPLHQDVRRVEPFEWEPDPWTVPWRLLLESVGLLLGGIALAWLSFSD